jgi:hypothetical protein
MGMFLRRHISEGICFVTLPESQNKRRCREPIRAPFNFKILLGFPDAINSDVTLNHPKIGRYSIPSLAALRPFSALAFLGAQIFPKRLNGFID